MLKIRLREAREIRHSGKSRFCPSCDWCDTLKWGARMKKRTLRVPHRHVVMTLSHILPDLVKRNKKELLNILMHISAETVKGWIVHSEQPVHNKFVYNKQRSFSTLNVFLIDRSLPFNTLTVYI